MTLTNRLDWRGWALIASAVISAILALNYLFDLSHGKAWMVAALLGTLLFMAGLTVVVALQEGDQLQLVGIGLMELAAAIAFVLTAIALFGGSFSDSLATTSAMIGMIGDVIVGALTIRRKVFPVWVGWLLGISGVVNFVTGQLDGGTWLRVVASIGALLAAGAIAAYGWIAVQRARPAEAAPRPA